MQKKKAVIFDMDGVISDTQVFHALIESEILKELGIDLSADTITHRYAGVPDEVMFQELFEQHGIKGKTVSATIRKKWDVMEKKTKGKITSIPHSIALIRTLKQNGFRLAIASASPKTFIDAVINELHISTYFDALVSTYDVRQGKPAPDIFLLAAHKLGVHPYESVVIEDGRSGMIGAKNAKMQCIGLVADKKGDYPATKLVASLEDITIEMIQGL